MPYSLQFPVPLPWMIPGIISQINCWFSKPWLGLILWGIPKQVTPIHLSSLSLSHLPSKHTHTHVNTKNMLFLITWNLQLNWHGKLKEMRILKISPNSAFYLDIWIDAIITEKMKMLIVWYWHSTKNQLLYLSKCLSLFCVLKQIIVALSSSKCLWIWSDKIKGLIRELLFCGSALLLNSYWAVKKEFQKQMLSQTVNSSWLFSKPSIWKSYISLWYDDNKSSYCRHLKLF
jgi:hypothetical protein